MYELLIDTSAEEGSIALYQEDRLCVTRSLGREFNHLQTLHVNIKQILEEEKISLQDINLVGCDIGPGSFTGIRIGVTTARTISQLNNCLIYPAVSLDVLCAGSDAFPGIIVPVIDGKKGRVYSAVYEKKVSGIFRRLSDYFDITAEELCARINNYQTQYQEVLFLGSGQDIYRGHLEKTVLVSQFSGPASVFPEAKNIHYLQTPASLTKDYNMIKPFYLRKPDAEEKIISSRSSG